jgi:7-carboxy-7-deazaguanine synthase
LTGTSGPGDVGAATLVVHEIYTSIQGETTEVGRPCTFVRLTGCDLRCSWCDTPHAFHEGQRRTVADVVATVRADGVGFVTLTGGEPLLQAACAPLLTALLDAGCEVQVETGGHLAFDHLDRRARIIMDVKLPDSGEHERVRWENLAALSPHDQVKLVVASRGDYEAARDLVRGRLHGVPGPILVQAATGSLAPTALAEWILADRLPVRFSIQLHAVLWPGRRSV